MPALGWELSGARGREGHWRGHLDPGYRRRWAGPCGLAPIPQHRPPWLAFEGPLPAGQGLCPSHAGVFGCKKPGAKWLLL